LRSAADSGTSAGGAAVRMTIASAASAGAAAANASGRSALLPASAGATPEPITACPRTAPAGARTSATASSEAWARRKRRIDETPQGERSSLAASRRFTQGRPAVHGRSADAARPTAESRAGLAQATCYRDRMKPFRLLAAALPLALLVSAPAPARQAEPAPLSELVAEVDIPYETFTLPNGLTTIVHTDRKRPVVGVTIYYRVGSK